MTGPSRPWPTASAIPHFALACVSFAVALVTGMHKASTTDALTGVLNRGALTVSIGLAEAAAGATAEDLLRGADVALYSAKGAGRNRVALYGALAPA